VYSFGFHTARCCLMFPGPPASRHNYFSPLDRPPPGFFMTSGGTQRHSFGNLPPQIVPQSAAGSFILRFPSFSHRDLVKPPPKSENVPADSPIHLWILVLFGSSIFPCADVSSTPGFGLIGVYNSWGSFVWLLWNYSLSLVPLFTLDSVPHTLHRFFFDGQQGFLCCLR